MATSLHEVPTARTEWFRLSELWASLAITAMWVAVLVTAVFGGDMHFQDSSGSGSQIPSAVAVALFAAIASWGVAKHGYRHRG